MIHGANSPQEHQPTLSEPDLEALARLVREHTGIALSGRKRSLVASRLARRLRACGAASWPEYLALLRAGSAPGELAELVNRVTINKTEFFREPRHFEHLRGALLPELERRAERGAPRRVRLWSAGCSSGEEPYSLAMALREHFAQAPGWQLEVIATDVDTEVLARAAAGVYADERLDDVPAELRSRHFLRGRGRWCGHYRVRAELRELVRFRRLNFVAPEWDVAGPFDAIFCRNVVIYFDRATQERLFRRLHALLGEGGQLVVGQSESAHFLPELFAPLDGTVYRRLGPASAAGTVAPALPAPAEAAPRPQSG